MLKEYLEKICIPEHGIAKVLYCYDNPPVRKPNCVGNRNNVVCLYPSEKNGVLHELESHKVELPAAKGYDKNSKVPFWRSQAMNLTIKYISSAGNKISPLTTPDFLVIEDGAVYLDEWKHLDDLERLVIENPGRFQKNGDGGFRSLPGEIAAMQFGFKYRVRPHTDINPYTYDGWVFLEDYCHPDTPNVSAEKIKSITKLLEEEQFIRLKDLLDVREDISADDIYTLIAQGVIKYACDRVPLHDTDSVVVAISDEHLDTYYDAFLAYNDSLDEMTPIRLDEHETLARSSPKQIRSAIKKQEIVHKLNSTGYSKDLGSRSTVYSWLYNYNKAITQYGVGLRGLLSKRPGPSMARRLNEFKFFQKTVEEHFATNISPNKKKFWKDYKRLAEAAGAGYYTYPHTCRLLDREDQYKIVLNQLGKGAASELENFIYTLDYESPRHGQYPFHIAHIDHTVVDVVLVDEETGEALDQSLYITLMVDAYTRRVLAMYMSFDPPSNRSILMVFRDCVRRHNKYPKIIVTDRGPEFKSVYFSQLAARFYFTIKLRPGKKPKYGAVMERLFGTANSEFFHNLVGNTKNRNKNFRKITKEVNPKNLAIWTFSALFDETEKYFFETYNNAKHGSLTTSPNNFYDQKLEIYGKRKHVEIPYDRQFLIDTLPSAPNTRSHKENIDKDTRTATKSGAIRLWGIQYLSDALKNLPRSERDVPVRFDPMNICHVFAFVKGHWERCVCRFESQLSHKTERELMMVSEVLRKRGLISNNITTKEERISHDFSSVRRKESKLSDDARKKQSANSDFAEDRQSKSRQTIDLPAYNSPDIANLLARFEQEAERK